MRNIAAPVAIAAVAVATASACQPSTPSANDSPAAVAPSASTAPTLVTSCQLGYRWGAAETFIPGEHHAVVEADGGVYQLATPLLHGLCVTRDQYLEIPQDDLDFNKELLG